VPRLAILGGADQIHHLGITSGSLIAAGGLLARDETERLIGTLEDLSYALIWNLQVLAYRISIELRSLFRTET
jgi:hypothetical protein